MKRISLIFSLFILGCATTTNLDQIKEASRLVNSKDGINKKEAIVVAQDCLINSEHSGEYNPASYDISYDKGEFPFTNLWKFGRSAWLVQFKSKQKNDTCMYGAVIFKDGAENDCGCMYGM